jgi:hypothetical protein
MGARGELFTTQIMLDRHQIAIFAEDMQKFLQGMDKSLQFIEKDRKARAKLAREKKAAKDAKYGKGGDKKLYYVKDGENKPEVKRDDGIKRTGRVIHIVSKRTASGKEESETVIEKKETGKD